jgi:DNA-binding NarL/FixJ family response regulator
LSDFENINLNVLLVDSDFYAQQAINGVLAWDRRTRVTHVVDDDAEMWRYLEKTPMAELPDVIILDSDHMGGPLRLRQQIEQLHQRIDKLMIICLAQFVDVPLIDAAAEAGARAYLLKSEVRLQIAWAIAYAMKRDFLVTPSIARQVSLHEEMHMRSRHAVALPKPREFPQLTGRVRQAIELCVIKGMPAVLAADEMSISLHTIRSYIKEGYRILEAADETEYPVDMSPQERAFMRLTRPNDEES